MVAGNRDDGSANFPAFSAARITLEGDDAHLQFASSNHTVDPCR
jgi:hypothetical protein